MVFKVRIFQESDQLHLDRIRRSHLVASAPQQRLADLSLEQQIERMENWYNEKVVYLQNIPICRTYVAVNSLDLPIGYVVVMAEAKDDFRPERQGFLCDLAVDEIYWGQDVALALVEAAEAYVKRMGHEFMMLNVSAFNQRAVNFYRKLGFVDEWVMMGKRLSVDRPLDPEIADDETTGL
ncbi:MAG: GNAT family N-acetyltransferase [Candidatus Poribacteria bacterium]|jgi:ribosomal protein S18 acetylase RimI-like enzyme|nr:GNAT family N-acetyltransferase [Candidatus Poribacteria bacterium]